MICFQMIMFCVAIAKSMVMRVEAIPITSACLNRPNSYLLQLLRQHGNYGQNQTHESYFSSPNGSLFVTSKATGKSLDITVAGTHGPLGSPGSCDGIPTGQIHERSLCAWHYVINHNEARYPQSITEAYRHPDCSKCTAIGKNEAVCQAVLYKVPVLYRRDVSHPDQCDCQGYYQYDFGYHDQVLGYTCRKLQNLN